MFNKIVKVLAFIEAIGLLTCSFMILMYVDGLKGLFSIPLILFSMPYFYIAIKENEDE